MFPARARTLFWFGLLAIPALSVHPADAPSPGDAPFKVAADFEVQPWSASTKPGPPATGPAPTPVQAFAAATHDDLAAMFGADFPPAFAEAVLGPDGRLYRITIPKDTPGEATVTRTEADGSNPEVFCRGLRDPRGLAFDNHGNLFTADAGGGQDDQGRWLFLLENGDYGWRAGWSRSALDPARVPWQSEKPWARRFDGQSASALPPVANVPVGSGKIVHYPGTGFLPRYDDHFFVDNPTRKAIFFWCMRPNGAGFLFLDQEAVCSGAVVRDLAFRPGSRLEFLTEDESAASVGGGGGLYDLHIVNYVPDNPSQEASRLLGGELNQKAPIDLAGLLKHPDQRIRLATEWRLAVSSSPDAEYFLRDVALAPNGGPQPQIARLHAIWGLGILARRAEKKTPGAGAKVLEPLLRLLEDEDLEVQSQAARVLADFRFSSAFDDLIKMLRNPDERVSMFGAQALAKLGNRDALPQLILMLRDAGDHDPNLRYAYVQALLGLRDFPLLEEVGRNESPPVRMGALLAMRFSRRAEVARFLQDQEPALVLEAARAISDENLVSALPDLAALIEHPSSDDALMCRVLDANFRVGESASAAALANFAARDDLPAPLRLDALNLLALWPKPPASDYVTGAPITLAARDAAPARAALEAVWPKLSSASDPKVSAAAAQTRQALSPASK